MHWVIQRGLYSRDNFIALTDALERRDLPHVVVDMSANGERTLPDVRPEGPVMVCGALRLARIATTLGWVPGSFANANHDQRVWGEPWHGHLVNGDAITCRLDEFKPTGRSVFMRPCEDNKAFSGQVFSPEEMVDLQRRAAYPESAQSALRPEVMVAHATPKTIMREARFFVVDGRLVAHGTYRVGSHAVCLPNVDVAATDFAQRMVDIYAPARAFVLDVALTENGYAVVEVNCINSAGFNGADAGSIVEAIEGMDFLEYTPSPHAP